MHVSLRFPRGIPMPQCLNASPPPPPPHFSPPLRPCASLEPITVRERAQMNPISFERDAGSRASSQTSPDADTGEAVELQAMGRRDSNALPVTVLRFGDRVLVCSSVGGVPCYLTSSGSPGAHVEWLFTAASKLRFRLSLPGMGKASGATNDQPWPFIVVGGPIGTPVGLEVRAQHSFPCSWRMGFSRGLKGRHADGPGCFLPSHPPYLVPLPPLLSGSIKARWALPTCLGLAWFPVPWMAGS
jgi:hypothetical protein